MDGFAPEALTEDALMGGRVLLLQPRDGYRAATDPVLLAAAVPARTGEAVLDLGCGAGAAALCLAARVPGLVLHGVERQAAYAALASANAARNGAALAVWGADIAALPAELRMRSFDHVLANPPWFDVAAPPARDPGRDAAQREETPLALWVRVGLRRLRPGGRLTLIAPAERLPGLLAAAGDGRGATVLPLAARSGRPAGRVIVQLRKGARSPFRLLAPLVLHAGAEHLRDGEDYSPAALAVLRDGAALALA
jgi:tRNA1Val (adenine37-N6)-methyltransferase